jgi:hypothetical protein
MRQIHPNIDYDIGRGSENNGREIMNYNIIQMVR